MRSRYVAQALQEIGATVEIFEPHFASDTPDTVWLPEVSQRGWFVLTKDDNIGRNPLEQIALPSALQGVTTTLEGLHRKRSRH